MQDIFVYLLQKKNTKKNIKATVEIEIDDDVIDHRKDGVGCQMLISIFLP